MLGYLCSINNKIVEGFQDIPSNPVTDPATTTFNSNISFIKTGITCNNLYLVSPSIKQGKVHLRCVAVVKSGTSPSDRQVYFFQDVPNIIFYCIPEYKAYSYTGSIPTIGMPVDLSQFTINTPLEIKASLTPLSSTMRDITGNNVNKYIGKEIHLNNQKKCLKILELQASMN
jgi:hypothetical protein